MKNQKGFSLIELLIVVAIILIIAAIAIPSLVRARIASNESAFVGDIRTVISAEATFASAANAYAPIACLSNPAGCFPAAGGMMMLDTVVATLQPKSGYAPEFFPGDDAGGATPGLLTAYVYGAPPVQVGRTGFKGFAGDFTGLICWTEDGTVPANAGGQLAACVNTLGRQ